MKRILGLDHGERRIGLALSDPLQIIAKPFKTIDVKLIDNLYDLINDIPEKPGIYIFYATPAGLKEDEGIFATMKTIMYVGIARKSGSLKSRYKRHYRKPKFQQCQQTYMRNFKYSYIVLKNIDEIEKLRSYEQLIINLFGPPLNDRNEIVEETLDRSIVKS